MDGHWHLDRITSCLSFTLRRRTGMQEYTWWSTEATFCLRELSHPCHCKNDTSHANPSPIYDSPFASAGIKSKPSTGSWAYFCSWLTSRAVKPVCVNFFICVFCWRTGKCTASDSHSLISILFFCGDSRACGWPGAVSVSVSLLFSRRPDNSPPNVLFPASVEIK